MQIYRKKGTELKELDESTLILAWDVLAIGKR